MFIYADVFLIFSINSYCLIPFSLQGTAGADPNNHVRGWGKPPPPLDTVVCHCATNKPIFTLIPMITKASPLNTPAVYGAHTHHQLPLGKSTDRWASTVWPGVFVSFRQKYFIRCKKVLRKKFKKNRRRNTRIALMDL